MASVYDFVGYHQTSEELAHLILRDYNLLCGTGGLCGGGIYLAVSPAATQRKAHRHGVVLEVRVSYTRAKDVDASGDRSLNRERLARSGYDAVRCHRPGADGMEFVVYDSRQVRTVRIHGAAPSASLQASAARGGATEISRICEDHGDGSLDAEDMAAFQQLPPEKQRELLSFIQCFKKTSVERR